eukprot:m.15381 g.15381  ORF g.15381 m.15381 type:complete len:640 (-) comp3260_c0_seq1:112-2031(-)
MGGGPAMGLRLIAAFMPLAMVASAHDNCTGICFTNIPTTLGCFCSPLCSAFNNCCPDYFSTCVNAAPTASTAAPIVSASGQPTFVPSTPPTWAPSPQPSASPVPIATDAPVFATSTIQAASVSVQTSSPTTTVSTTASMIPTTTSDAAFSDKTDDALVITWWTFVIAGVLLVSIVGCCICLCRYRGASNKDAAATANNGTVINNPSYLPPDEQHIDEVYTDNATPSLAHGVVEDQTQHHAHTTSDGHIALPLSNEDATGDGTRVWQPDSVAWRPESTASVYDGFPGADTTSAGGHDARLSQHSAASDADSLPDNSVQVGDHDDAHDDAGGGHGGKSSVRPSSMYSGFEVDVTPSHSSPSEPGSGMDVDVSFGNNNVGNRSSMASIDSSMLEIVPQESEPAVPTRAQDSGADVIVMFEALDHVHSSNMPVDESGVNNPVPVRKPTKRRKPDASDNHSGEAADMASPATGHVRKLTKRRSHGSESDKRPQSTYSGFTDPSDSDVHGAQADDDRDDYQGFAEWTVADDDAADVTTPRPTKSMDLEAQPWYTGQRSQEECEAAVLMANSGDFLVRSQGGVQFIHVNENGRLVTLKVVGGPESQCTCMGREFPSLVHVIEYLLRVPLVGTTGNPVHLGVAASTV